MSQHQRSRRTVELPEHVLDRVASRLAYTEFESVDEYVTFVIEEALARVEAQANEEEAVDEEEIRTRLESLGYLDV